MAQVVADIFRRAKQPSFVLAPAFIIASVIRILELTFRAGINMQADYMASTWELSDEAMRTLTVSYMVSPLAQVSQPKERAIFYALA